MKSTPGAGKISFQISFKAGINSDLSKIRGGVRSIAMGQRMRRIGFSKSGAYMEREEVCGQMI